MYYIWFFRSDYMVIIASRSPPLHPTEAGLRQASSTELRAFGPPLRIPSIFFPMTPPVHRGAQGKLPFPVHRANFRVPAQTTHTNPHNFLVLFCFTLRQCGPTTVDEVQQTACLPNLSGHRRQGCCHIARLHPQSLPFIPSCPTHCEHLEWEHLEGSAHA